MKRGFNRFAFHENGATVGECGLVVAVMAAAFVIMSYGLGPETTSRSTKIIAELHPLDAAPTHPLDATEPPHP